MQISMKSSFLEQWMGSLYYMHTSEIRLKKNDRESQTENEKQILAKTIEDKG